MDPLQVKLIQLLVAQALGIGLIVLGGHFFIKGIRGKTGTILIEGAGIKAKIANSSPGVLLMILGVIVLSLSLSAKIEPENDRTAN